ncbi:MAG: hypothetical protein PHU21_08315 [Elusimicrobia bacterium]|nr:hypothetical protein [Elusimicrobiota bacterium]
MAKPVAPDFEKLARETVTSRLKGMPADTAAEAAAAVAGKIVIAAASGKERPQDPHLMVAGVCRGVMSGMLLIEKDLVQTAVELVKSMAHLGAETHLDPTELMTWAMEAVAEVCALGHPDLGASVREALEHNFIGTGEVFGGLLLKAAKDRQP